MGFRPAASAFWAALAWSILAGAANFSAAVAHAAAPLATVNLAGAEFTGDELPGVLGRDYIYPSTEEIDYFLGKGFAGVRLPFRWERLQREPSGKLHKTELREIDRIVNTVTGAGGTLILDVHNYGRYRGERVLPGTPTEQAFLDLWRKLSRRYQDNALVVFGLMNEPHGIPAADWAASAQKALWAIREEGAQNLVLVPGTAWSGAHSWKGSGNADALKVLKDPANNFAFEVHQYLDGDYSGTDPSCQSPGVGAAALEGMTAWLQETGTRAFLGEFGAGGSAICLRALGQMLEHMHVNADAWMGWSYWAAGAWWGDYPFSIHPRRDGETAPQMRILEKFLNAAE